MARIGTETRILRLVEHQATQFELRRRLREEGSLEMVKEYPHLPEGPWVTISKSEGSGGIEVARLLAARLGWAAYDRELIETIARKQKVHAQVLSALDERLVGDLENYVALMAVKDYPGASVLAKRLMGLITTLGRHGKVILVGRGAQFLLRPEYGVRVRIDADIDQRVQQYARENHVAKHEARRRVRRIDSQRSAWIRRYFHGSLDDPLAFDLVINTTHITAEQAADLVTDLVRSRFERQVS